MNYPLISNTYRSHANGEPVVLPIVIDLHRSEPAEYAWRDAFEIVTQVSGRLCVNALHLAMRHIVVDVIVPGETADIDAFRADVQATLDGLFSAHHSKRLEAEDVG